MRPTRVRRVTKCAAAMASGVVLIALTSCGFVPLVSDSGVWDDSTSIEQQQWASGQADAALDVLDQPGGWWEYSPEYPWPEDQESILEDAEVASCRPSEGFEQPGQLILRLHTDKVENSLEAARRLKAHWIAEGWTVRYVINPEDAKRPSEYFRADQDNGAMLALDAYEHYISLYISTACSDHASVVYR